MGSQIQVCFTWKLECLAYDTDEPLEAKLDPEFNSNADTNTNANPGPRGIWDAFKGQMMLEVLFFTLQLYRPLSHLSISAQLCLKLVTAESEAPSGTRKRESKFTQSQVIHRSSEQEGPLETTWYNSGFSKRGSGSAGSFLRSQQQLHFFLLHSDHVLGIFTDYFFNLSTNLWNGYC